MSTEAQLKARGRELAKAIEDINGSEMTEAEKGAALDRVQGDWDTHMLAVKNSERASEMAAKLGENGNLRTIEGEGDIVLPQLEVRNLGRIRRDLGAALLRHPKYQESIKALNDFDKPKGQFDFTFNVDAKDATAANNIIGEGLTGTGSGVTGPTAAGQNPFLAGSVGAGILPTFLPGIVEQLFYNLHISDLISSIPVTSPDLSYLTESLATNNSAATAEGALYPFSNEQFSRVYEQVGKISNAATLTDEVVKDAPQLFSFIQGRLLEGIQRQEEIQLLAGSGYPGVNGLLNRSTGFTKPQVITASTNVKFPANSEPGAFVQQQNIASLTYGRKIQGATGVYPTATAIAEGIFAALVDIQLAVFNTPNAIVMHPNDWAVIRLAKDTAGQYFGGSFFGGVYGGAGSQGASVGNPSSLWGVPVVTSQSIPAGTVLVGYFDSSTIQTARREGVSMQLTNSNGTDFVQGKVTVRAEERLGLLVYRPSAFELINLVVGP
jgi:HK97 family phage major capsid protein